VGKKKEKEKYPSTKNIAKAEEQCGQQQQAKELWQMSLKTTCACSKSCWNKNMGCKIC
jgi:hypothetical protein